MRTSGLSVGSARRRRAARAEAVDEAAAEAQRASAPVAHEATRVGVLAPGAACERHEDEDGEQENELSDAEPFLEDHLPTY